MKRLKLIIIGLLSVVALVATAVATTMFVNDYHNGQAYNVPPSALACDQSAEVLTRSQITCGPPPADFPTSLFVEVLCLYILTAALIFIFAYQLWKLRGQRKGAEPHKTDAASDAPLPND